MQGTITGEIILNLRATDTGWSDISGKNVGLITQAYGQPTNINCNTNGLYGDKVISVTENAGINIGPTPPNPTQMAHWNLGKNDLWTFCCWCKLTKPESPEQDYPILLGFGNPGSVQNFYAGISGSGVLTLSLDGATNTYIECGMNILLYDGDYHHIAIEKYSVDEYAFYVDGIRGFYGKLNWLTLAGSAIENTWDGSQKGLGLFYDRNGRGNTYFHGDIYDMVFIKGQALWDKKYYEVPTTYLTDGGYNLSVDTMPSNMLPKLEKISAFVCAGPKNRFIKNAGTIVEPKIFNIGTVPRQVFNTTLGGKFSKYAMINFLPHKSERKIPVESSLDITKTNWKKASRDHKFDSKIKYFSISFWFKIVQLFTDHSKPAILFNGYSSIYDKIALDITTYGISEPIGFAIVDYTYINRSYIKEKYVVDMNKWHHAALGATPLSGTDQLKMDLFIDGKLVYSYLQGTYTRGSLASIKSLGVRAGEPTITNQARILFDDFSFIDGINIYENKTSVDVPTDYLFKTLGLNSMTVPLSTGYEYDDNKESPEDNILGNILRLY